MLNRLILWLNPPSVLRTVSVPTKTRLECNKFASNLDIQLSSFYDNMQQKIKPFRRYEHTERLDKLYFKCYNKSR